MRDSATIRLILCAILFAWYRNTACESCMFILTCHDEETRSWRRVRKRLSSLRVPI
jgi:hypothetical protein